MTANKWRRKRLYHAFGTKTVQKNKYLKITNYNKWLALFDVIITISIYFTYMVTTKYNWGRSYTDKTPVIGKGLHTYITTCKGRHRGANTTGMWC